MGQPSIECDQCGQRIPLIGRYTECPHCGHVHDLHEIRKPES